MNEKLPLSANQVKAVLFASNPVTTVATAQRAKKILEAGLTQLEAKIASGKLDPKELISAIRAANGLISDFASSAGEFRKRLDEHIVLERAAEIYEEAENLLAEARKEQKTIEVKNALAADEETEGSPEESSRQANSRSGTLALRDDRSEGRTP